MNVEGKCSTRRENYNSVLGEQEFFVTPLLCKSIEESLESIDVPKKGAMVLDIGAGECPLRKKLEQLGYRYFSLDIEQNSYATIDYLARIDQTLPDLLTSHGGFDLLILTEVLEHVPDWKVAFENLALLLKPSGHCLITTPFFYMLHEEPYDFWRPTDHAINYFSSTHGFEVVRWQRTGDGWDVLGTLLCSTSLCRGEKNIWSYLPLVSAKIILKIAQTIFKSRIFQKQINLQMRYYIGNLFLIRKP